MKHNQQGLSLVELMIAITLGIVLMTGVVQTFLSSKTVFSTQKGVSRVQETGRLGMEFLARDIREAGYMGCLSRTGINYTSTLNDADSHEVNFEVGIEASNVAPVTLEHTPISPVLTLRSAAGSGVGLANTKTDNANLDVYNTGETSEGCYSGLCRGDILIITDCSKARVFQATTIAPNKQNAAQLNVVHSNAEGGNADPFTPGNKYSNWGQSNADDTFDLGSEIIKMRTRMYYVADSDPSDDNVRPGLFMKEGYNPSVELLKNVENMHLEFGVDTNFDGRVDNFVALKQVATVASWADVAAVKVELLVGSSEDNVSPDPRQYEFAGKTVTSADNRIRQVFTSTVGIRSRLN